MINLDFIEDSFIKKNATLYNLSAQIGAGRFSFLVLDKNQSVIVLRSYSFEETENTKSFFEKTYLQDDILKLSFASTKIAINNSKHTLVPNELFDENQKATYLGNLVELLPTEVVNFDNLGFLQAKNVYTVNQEIENLIKDSFNNVSIFHGSTAFILGTHLLADGHKDFCMYINVLNRKLNILLYNKKDLLFNNSFSFQSVRDFVYYVMMVLDQFKVNPEMVPVYLCGQIMRESEVYKLLFRYIKNIDFLEAPEQLTFRSKYEALNAYKFFDLFSLRVCE